MKHSKLETQNSKFIKQRAAYYLQNIFLLRWALRLAVRLFAPRQFVGVVGAVFNDSGQVLLVEHVFRPSYPWGLPGGWLEPGEHPAEGVRRELMEELGMRVETGDLLVCEPQGGSVGAPTGLGLAYYCRLLEEQPDTQRGRHGFEVLSIRWVHPDQINLRLTPIDREAIRRGHQVFLRQQANWHS